METVCLEHWLHFLFSLFEFVRRRLAYSDGAWRRFLWRKRIIQEQEGFGFWLFKFVFWWDRRRDWTERLVKSWWSRLDSSMGFFAVRVLRCNGAFRWKWMDNSLERWIIPRWEVVENSSARWIVLRWKMTVNSWKRWIVPRWKDIDLGLWFFGKLLQDSLEKWIVRWNVLRVWSLCSRYSKSRFLSRWLNSVNSDGELRYIFLFRRLYSDLLPKASKFA